MDAHTERADAQHVIAATLAEEHPTWGDHDSHAWQLVEVGWAVRTWAIAMLVVAAIAAVATTLVASFSDTPLTGETNTELGVTAIIGAMSTFIGFAAVITLRLVKVSHDRLSNSFAVGIFHVLVAIALFAVELVLQSVGLGLADMFDGSWTDEVGNAFTTFERSSAAAILASLLAAGMVPAVGDRPRGTQVGATEQDRQL